MPTYEYLCECGRRFDKFYVYSSDREESSTCECGKQADRVFAAPASIYVPIEHRAGFQQSPQHEKWFHSEDTQRKLRTGELQHVKRTPGR